MQCKLCRTTKHTTEWHHGRLQAAQSSPERCSKISATRAGVKFSVEHKKALSEACKGKKFGPRPTWVREKISSSQKGVARSPDVIRKMVETKTGSKVLSTRGALHWNWKGGKRRNPYYFQKYRRLILKRDNYTCKICNKSSNDLGSTSRLHIHHIDHNKFNDSIDNLVTACYKCNNTAERLEFRGKWEPLLEWYSKTLNKVLSIKEESKVNTVTVYGFEVFGL